jgi:hypothetical protein
VVKKYYRFRHGNLSRKRCVGMRVGWHPARDVVRLSFPARCFRALPQRILLRIASTRNFPANSDPVDDGPTATLHR